MAALSVRWRASPVGGRLTGIPRNRDALAVFGFALAVRLMFSLLMANTFDKDEFVYLALGHDVGAGAVPYRDFGYFHPPGILVLIGLLNPLTALWWPLARLADVALDSVTAVLVWRIAAELYARRVAWLAAGLYAVAPVVLVSAIRVDQEAAITLLATAGAALLVCRRTWWAALLAGICLAAAFWIKYPVAVFLPVYLLITPRRAAGVVLGFAGAALLLFLPYAGHMGTLYHETVTWQVIDRYHTSTALRLQTVAVSWLLLNPFAVAGSLTRRKPLWLIAGFGSGAVFLLTSSVYSHYFVPLAPYASILGAPVAHRLFLEWKRALIPLSLALTVVTPFVIQTTGQPYIIAYRFSSIAPIVALVRHTTAPGTPVLSSRFEFAYLAGRPWVAHYFWDDQSTITSHALERHLAPRSIGILYPHSDFSAYPPGLVEYLEDRDPQYALDGASIWVPRAVDVDIAALVREPDATVPS